MTKPELGWIDPESSKQLPILRAKGEGQSLEFMSTFPSNTRDLAKEIAAFATSNAGTILIGVDNSGDCLGMPELTTAAERDVLLRRLEGICNGSVKPAITPTARFAMESERIVLVLSVPKGSQPVYYAHGVPYLRHITSSRPAEPHEVLELVRSTLAFVPRANEIVEEEQNARVQFLAQLMRNLVRIRIFGEELDERMVNPWFDLWRAQFADVASELRNAAAQQIAVDERINTAMLDAAEALSAAANLRMHLSSGPELERLTETALSKTESLLERISPDVIPHVLPQQLRQQLAVLQRELETLGRDAERARAEGSVEDLQALASEIGSKILFTAQYGVNRLAPDLRSALTTSGRQLHLAETRRVYIDGGASSQRVIAGIEEAIALYNQAMRSIDQN